ncbi:MAG: polyribonucleotide nucleotidyltransferase [Planctomycetes bacterium]|nr:polyribonucleotide nucleotidyltransferase [Planctomycetota bacterium]
MKVTVEREIGGRILKLETGELAKQAHGAVIVQYGETWVFVATVSGPPRSADQDFFPLTVDYRERFAAAGKFPGGFLKREARPSTREILTARLTDRPIRPLFPEGYYDEVQVMGNVLSFDGENDPDVLSINGASTALMLAPVPFNGPIGAVRIGLIDGQFVVMPTMEQLKTSKLDLIVAGSKDSVLMIEGFGDQLSEDQMLDAILLAQREIAKICELQEELCAKIGKARTPGPVQVENPFTALLQQSYSALKAAKANPKKAERHSGTDAIKSELKARYFPEGAEATTGTPRQFSEAFGALESKVVRDLIQEGVRLDGRKTDELRVVTCSVGVVPRIHGSAVFTRGETQSLAQITLGTGRDTQKVDGPVEEYEKRFMLDYNFPPYSVGECRKIGSPGRREIGHGMLAERSVQWIIPSAEKFPYTIRTISDIMESNGSSSMASVCSATLALMDAGVPITQPVAGISIGLVKDGDKYTLLTDIMGDEDHFGDMDFKVAGTGKGITGIQLDLKIAGINEAIIRDTLAQAKEARRVLLKTMLGAIGRPRADISPNAPRLHQIKIDPEKIGLLIGPGGKTIRAIQEESQTTLDVGEDGTVTVAGMNAAGLEAAIARIEALTAEIKVGRVYTGKVASIKDFGAFVEIAPGKDGLCHISELAEGYVKSVHDVVKIGDIIEVKVIAVDDQNRVKLSRKAILAEKAQAAGGGEAPAE